MNMPGYEETRRSFRLVVPENFNYTRDVVDAWAKTYPNKLGLVAVDQYGKHRREFTFARLAQMATRVANALAGLGAGERVVVMLSLAGFGTPVPAPSAASTEAYAEWLLREIERLGTPVHQVGHDRGAILAQRVVSFRPDLIHTWACGGGVVGAEYVWDDIAQSNGKPLGRTSN